MISPRCARRGECAVAAARASIRPSDSSWSSFPLLLFGGVRQGTEPQFQVACPPSTLPAFKFVFVFMTSPIRLLNAVRMPIVQQRTRPLADCSKALYRNGDGG